MIRNTILRSVDANEFGGPALVIVALVFLWLLAATLTLVLIFICFAPGHVPVGESFRQLYEALPADASFWMMFTA